MLPPRYPLQDVEARFDYKLDNGNGRLADGLHDEYQRLLLTSRDRERKRIRGGDVGGDDANNDVDMAGDLPSDVDAPEIRPPKRRLLALMAHPEPRSPSQTPVLDFEDMPQLLPLPLPSASPVQEAKAPIPEETLMIRIPSTQAELINTMLNLLTYLNERNQNHLVFRLLRNANRATLCLFSALLQNTLKRDLVLNLPLEITNKILGYLDHRTLLSLQLVCKSWYRAINNNHLWINLLKTDKLITDDATIQRDLEDPHLIEEWCQNPRDLTRGQILYKKRCIIYNRWMDPNYSPERIHVKGYGSKVVTCLQHDDEKIVTGVDEKLINIYCTKTGKLLRVLEGHEGGVWALKYTGNTLVTGSTDRTVRVWNIRTGKCTHIFRGHTLTIRCLDIIHPRVIGKDDRGEDIVFPQFPILVTGSRDMNLHVWRLPMNETDEETRTFDLLDSNNPYLISVLLGHSSSVRLVSGCGNIVVLGSYDSTVRVWDLMQNGKCTHILTGHTDRVYLTALDFDLKICFSGSMDATINVWNFGTGKHIKTLEGHGQLVGLLNLVDGVLVLAAADASLVIWNPKTYEQQAKLKGHTSAITCFEHDGLRVVSGLLQMLKLWDVKKGEFARDLLTDVTEAIWQVRIDYKRCVAAVQTASGSGTDENDTYIEILDFSAPLYPRLTT